MIKKFLIGLFSLFFIMPAMGNVIISADAIHEVVAAKVAPEKQLDVVRALAEKQSANTSKQGNLQLSGIAATIVDAARNNFNGGLSSADMVDVCSVAGWILEKEGSENFNKCVDFTSALIKKGTVDFYNVCSETVDVLLRQSMGHGAKCFSDFKNVQVDRRAAYNLSKILIYTRLGKQEKSVECAKTENKWGKEHNDDFVPCTSRARDYYYAVHFDDATESKDNTRRNGIAQAVGIITGYKYTEGGCSAGGQFGGSTCWGNSFAASDANKCKEVDKYMKLFGFSANFKSNKCEASFDTIGNKSDLKHPFGLDSFAFCRDIQIGTNATLDQQVENYVRGHSNVPVTSFRCDLGDVKYTGGDCTSKFGNYADDVLKCYVNEQEVDFVFDDLAELREYISNAGWGGVSCTASGGSYDGRNCRLLGEENCNQLIDVLKNSCPNCDIPQWNGTTCYLPSSAKADNINKAVKVVTVTGLAVTGVVLMFVPGAQGGAAVAFGAIGQIGTGLVIAGAAAEVTSEIAMTYGVFGPFADRVERCKNEECAKQIISEMAQTITSYKKEFTDAEKKSVDDLLNHLFDKVPADSDFWLEFMQDESVFDPVTCKIKEKKQLWQHVRTAGVVAQIVGALLPLGAKAVEKTTETITKKISEKVYAFGNSGKPGILLRGTQSGIARTTGGSFLNKFGLKFGTPYTWDDAANILREAGVTTDIGLYRGCTWANEAQGLLRLKNGRYASAIVRIPGTEMVSTHTMYALNLAGFANPALATAAMAGGRGGYYASHSAEGYKVPQCLQNQQVDIEILEVPIESDENVTKTSVPILVEAPSVTPINTPTTNVGTNPEISESTPAVTPVSDTPAPSESTSVVTSNQNASAATDVTSTSDKGQDNDKKSGISGLGAAAIGAGVAGLGVGAALLIGGAGKNDKTSGATTTIKTNGNAELFNSVKSRANGIIGYVGDSSIELVPIETAKGTKDTIVSIDGHAVVVAKHNGNLIPFVVDTENGVTKWMPFTNVNVNTHVFNKYVPKTDIMRTAQIAEKLTEVLPPLQVQYFASPNDTGMQFASPSMNGYTMINDNSLRYMAFNFNKNTRLGVFLFG